MPHIELWRQLPGLVREGCQLAHTQCRRIAQTLTLTLAQILTLTLAHTLALTLTNS